MMGRQSTVHDRKWGGRTSNMNKIARSIAMALTISVLFSGIAHAQWVFVGRKALGKVKQLTSEADSYQESQQAKGQNIPQQGYDAATVLLEAPADKVYSTAISIMQSNKDILIKKKDDKALSIEFIHGSLAAGMQITSLSEKLSQLLVVSTRAGKADSSIVLKAVMRICNEMGVHCQSPE
ncbi:MAG: hypothetical protein H6Q52_2533 [Deltaproteobacteria bacterium]|nr:hypothetical protein [Deltaproteobacteria bacterium]